jgi:hypothetical protein
MTLILGIQENKRKQELKDQLTLAAESLMQDYSSDKELIAFTNLDFENFYEAR